jgi:Mg2+ and Co2+ transporter CorA
MSDQEKKDELKAEEYYERKSTTDNNESDLSPSSSPSSSPRTKGIKDKIVGKISSTTGKSQEENNVNLSESARVSNNVRTVILGLFTLIGFIILVFAVFTASIGAQLNQVQFANSVFIAAIVGAFTLVGVIVYQIRGSNGR